MEAPSHFLYLWDSKNVRFSTRGQWHAETFEFYHLMKHQFFSPLTSFMWLTVSSTFSWGHYWNSFVLVGASLLVQEFCFTFASKTCQRQIRTRNSNLCFKGINSSEKYFYLHSPLLKKVSSQDDEPQHTTVKLLQKFQERKKFLRGVVK